MPIYHKLKIRTTQGNTCLVPNYVQNIVFSSAFQPPFHRCKKTEKHWFIAYYKIYSASYYEIHYKNNVYATLYLTMMYVYVHICI